MLCAGGAVWFTEKEVGFMRFANGKVEAVPGVLPVVRTAYLEPNETLWGSYPDGRVFRFQSGKYREFGTQDGLPAGQVNEDRIYNEAIADGGRGRLRARHARADPLAGSVRSRRFHPFGAGRRLW